MGQVSEAGEIAIEQKMFDNLQVESVGDAMVKMDIEGFELSALKGMQEFIRTHKPYLAICIYHKEKVQLRKKFSIRFKSNTLFKPAAVIFSHRFY